MGAPASDMSSRVSCRGTRRWRLCGRALAERSRHFLWRRRWLRHYGYTLHACLWGFLDDAFFTKNLSNIKELLICCFFHKLLMYRMLKKLFEFFMKFTCVGCYNLSCCWWMIQIQLIQHINYFLFVGLKKYKMFNWCLYCYMII
jgi:hypothetical protein